MPFTATHVAAVLPFAWLCRWRVPLSALAIGSMIPDASGYFPRVFDYNATHSLRGVTTHCVPVGLMALYLFHLLLKQPLLDLLPRSLASRLYPWSQAGPDLRPSGIVVASGCLALGALTHIAWDSFTHAAGIGVRWFPALAQVVGEHEGRPIRVFSVLQHASSIVFLPPMVVGFLWWTMRQPPSMPAARQRVALPRTVSWTAMAMTAIGGWIFFHSLQSQNLDRTWVAALRTTVKHLGAASIVVLLLYSIGMQVTWWLQARSADRESLDEAVDSPAMQSSRPIASARRSRRTTP